MLWGWFFRETVFFNKILNYLALLIPLFSFTIIVLTEKGLNISIGKWYVPFLLYSIISNLLGLNISMGTELFLCILMMKTGYLINNKYIPQYLILFTGMFLVMGIIIQMTFPSLYTNFILPLFKNSNNISDWVEHEYGYAGFTYQLGMTATMLVICIFMLPLYKENHSISSLITLSLYIILTIAVFLTGKRTLSAISVICPLTLYLIMHYELRQCFFIILIFLGSYLLVSNFLSHYAESLTDNILFRRLGTSYLEFKSGGDITSGRSYLTDMAISAFKKSPIFGTGGAGSFIKTTNAYTDVHNAYIQTLCELGMIGFILLIVPLIVVFLKTIIYVRQASCEALPYLKVSFLLQLFFIIYSFTGNCLINFSNFGALFFAITLLIKANEIDQYE